MKLWKLFGNLHPIFLIGFLVGWNLLMLWGLHLNGGFGEFKNAGAALVSALAAALIALLAFGALYAPAIRAYVFRPTAAVGEVKDGLLLLGSVGILLTFMALLEAW